jgi:HD-GYP domain-containing protein (c-di-GMP phosphodiesterase class II)
MSESRVLLSKITALRQRLEQAQGLAAEVGARAGELAAGDDALPLRFRLLERQVEDGEECDRSLEHSLRDLEGPGGPAEAGGPLPRQLTARARRVVERGQEVLGKLRALGQELEGPGGPPADDPLARHYREVVAMADSALRLVQYLPDSAGVQLRLCGGLEGVVTQLAQRAALLNDLWARRRREDERVDALAGLLGALAGGRAADVQPFLRLAEALLSEAREGEPLRFLEAPPERAERFVACHCLTAAQVMARLVRHDADLRGRATEAVTAALVHDAGMLGVPAAVLGDPGGLDLEQRRLVEGHARLGAHLANRLLPSGAWLAEAAGAHHERLDGTGYPDGLRELQLGPLPRLLAVCDVYAALAAARPHRPAKETRTALTDTLLLAEKGALDRRRAELLLHLAFYPVGTAVELSDGAVGVVVAVHTDWADLATPARPVVAVLRDGAGRPLPAPRHLDLARSDSRSVVRSLSAAQRRELLGKRFPEWA